MNGWLSDYLTAICAALLVIASSAVLFKLASRRTPAESNTGAAKSAPQQGKQVFTKKEVSKHQTSDDCWIILESREHGGQARVYNVTDYVEEHPGGQAILNNAGGVSTQGFYGPQHPTRVFDMIEDFYIGDLAL